MVFLFFFSFLLLLLSFVPLCSLSSINLHSPASKFQVKFIKVPLWLLVTIRSYYVPTYLSNLIVTFEIITTSSQNDLFRNARSSSSFGVGLPRTVCAFVSGLSVLTKLQRRTNGSYFLILIKWICSLVTNEVVTQFQRRKRGVYPAGQSKWMSYVTIVWG